jgi:hypothetical protein
MAVALRSSTNFTTLTGLSAPAGTQATDILVVVFISESNVAITVPSGWTAIQAPTPAVWLEYSYWAPGNVASFAFAQGVSTTNSGTIMALTGVNTSAPITNSAYTSASVGGATTVTLPTVAANSGDFLILANSQQNSNIPGSATGSPSATNLNSVSSTTTGFALDYVSGLTSGATTAYTRSAAAFNLNTSIVISIAAAASDISASSRSRFASQPRHIFGSRR